MKPYKHACSSAVKYGGKWEDYIEIHNFMDSSKAHLSDWRHRALFHSTFGCFIVEKVFGETLTNSDGKVVCTRDIAEDHCVEDLGMIPSVEQWLRNMRIEPWMGGKRSKDKREGKQASRKIPNEAAPDPGPAIGPMTVLDGQLNKLDSGIEMYFNEANTDGVRPVKNAALDTDAEDQHDFWSKVVIDGKRPQILRGSAKLYD
jgi:hypothetical protein